MRKDYLRYCIPGELGPYVDHIIERRILGYRSAIELLSAALRKEIKELIRDGFIRADLTPTEQPKRPKPAPGAIGNL